MLLCKQAEQGVPLQAEQYDWLADTDEEIDEQKLEAHYSYMEKIQEVPTTDSGTDSEPLEQGNPQQALNDKGIIDSGCSRHMTRNISYLSDFEEINEGYVTFGGNPKGGKITGKDTECVILSSDFKLPDKNHVLLRVSRENNMYNIDLKNVVPSGDLTCLFAKAALNESNLWHRRLGHINFKTMNRLVKGNIVRGLPSKVFENNHTCVACKKGKQHRASCKSKSVSSVSHPLQSGSSSNPISTNSKHRNRIRLKPRVEPFSILIVTMADNCMMEEMLQEPTKRYGDSIMVPDILAKFFEIKTGLLSLIQANQFHSFESNNPHDHIRSFNMITTTLKFRDVPNDAIKLMLFPYSLEGAAKIWYEKEL
nr:ribonuclease H-like domain-containing protein [Tanacetum cinerariifolium]